MTSPELRRTAAAAANKSCATQGRTRAYDCVHHRATNCASSSMGRPTGCATSAAHRRPASKNRAASARSKAGHHRAIARSKRPTIGRDARPARISCASSSAQPSGHLAPIARPARDVRMPIARPAHPNLGSDTTVGEPWRIRIAPPGEAAEEQKMGRETINTIRNNHAMTFIGCLIPSFGAALVVFVTVTGYPGGSAASGGASASGAP
ncbi:hypothetical protein F511_34922 [Dorcoceras hygrometricum]|uniref:Uncharacterized protein n=1 Tax=Dorcoceras hygrometricum TaxID=472368 RepID=A0A2Z7BUY7_9LAMI|nr:hypothetical protein F511_34922 [Dorcoceras hygrometricum]